MAIKRFFPPSLTHEANLLRKSGWRSNRGYMFAMMLAMLALMAMMGVGLSRLMMTTKATTQMQRSQDTKQLMSSLLITLSSKAADSDGDFVLEPPVFVTAAIPGFTAPTNGGAVGTDVANVDAWGRRLGYCAYDYGSQPTAAITDRIRGSTASSPTDSWVAVVVISAGPDGVINTSCPAADMVASDVAAQGDDMVAARSYGEMVSFGNAQTVATLSALGTNSIAQLCRLSQAGKVVCDVSTTLKDSNTSKKLCRTDASGTLNCDGIYTDVACGSNQLLTIAVGGGAQPNFYCKDVISGCSAGQLTSWDGDKVICRSVSPCGDQQVSYWDSSSNSFQCRDLLSCSDSAGTHASNTTWTWTGPTYSATYSCDPYSCNPYSCSCYTTCDKDGKNCSESCSTCWNTCYNTCTAYCPSFEDRRCYNGQQKTLSSWITGPSICGGGG